MHNRVRDTLTYLSTAIKRQRNSNFPSRALSLTFFFVGTTMFTHGICGTANKDNVGRGVGREKRKGEEDMHLSLADKISIHSGEQWHLRKEMLSLFDSGSRCLKTNMMSFWFDNFANKEKTWLVSRNVCPTVWLRRWSPAPAPDPWAFA